MLSGTRSHSSPVAHSAATSLRPMPAPNAPSHPKCVVCESAPRISCPGSTTASSLSTWWQMPRPTSKKLRSPARPRTGESRHGSGVLGGGRRYGVVQRDRQPLGDEHPFLPKLLPDAANRRRVVVAQHHVRPGVHDLADLDLLKACGTGQRLLGKGLRSVRRNCCSQSLAS